MTTIVDFITTVTWQTTIEYRHSEVLLCCSEPSNVTIKCQNV